MTTEAETTTIKTTDHADTQGARVLVPDPLPFMMRVTLEVSSNFIDLDELACLRCGSPFTQSTLSIRWAITRDKHGDFVACRSCQARYYARGGRFIGHGEYNQTRWCAQCQEWRPSGLAGCVGEIHACHVCLSEFDGDGPLPAEYAALQAVKARLAAQATEATTADGDANGGDDPGAGICHDRANRQ